MKKILKFLVKLFAVFVVIIILAAIIVPRFVNIDSFKPAIEKVVKDQTGRNIVLNGPIKLNVFPWLKIKITDIDLKNAEGFAPENMVHIGEISAGVKIMPLLKKRIELGAILVDNISICYTVNKDSVTNIQDILDHMNAKNDTSENANSNVSTESEDSEKSSSFTLDLEGTKISSIDVQNSTITYEDMRNGMIIQAKPEIHTGEVGLNAPVDASVNLVINGQKPDFDFSMNFDTTVTANMQQVDISKLLLNILISAEGIDEQTLKLSTSGYYNIENAAFSLQNINLELLGLKGSGAAEGKKLNTSPELSGNFDIAEFSLRDLLTKMGLKDIVNTPNPAAYSKVSLGLSFNMADNKINAPVKMVLDSTTVDIAAKADLSKDKPYINLPVKINGIIVDDYLPQSSVAGTQAETTVKTAATNQSTDIVVKLPDLDLTTLPDIDANISLNNLHITGLKITDIVASASVHNGTASVSNISMNMADGKLTANAKVVGIIGKFEALANLNVADVNIHSLLKAVSPDTDTSSLPKKLNVAVSANAKNNMVNITTANVNLDDITVKSTASADLNSRLKIKATVNVNDVDLNKFTGNGNSAQTAKTAETDKTDTKTSSDSDTTTLPLGMLTNAGLDADVTLNINSVAVSSIKTGAINLTLQMTKGLLKLTPKIVFYEGNIGGLVSVSEKSNSFESTGNLDISKVKIEKFLADLRGKSSPLNGVFGANLKLTSQGDVVQNMLNTLNGSLSYSITGAVVNGIAYNGVSSLTSDLTSFSLFGKDKSTKINDITGNATIKNGLLGIDTVKLTSASISGDLGGNIGLAAQSLDLGGNIIVSNISIPYQVKGNINSPEISIDESTLITNLLKNAVSESVKTEVKENIQQNINDAINKNVNEKVGDTLKNIFQK